MYYHFAFLAISIALFGLSASGVFAYVRARLARPAPDRSPAGGRSRSSTPSRRSSRSFFLVRLRVGLNYSPENLRADAGHLRAGGAALLHRRAGHHAGDLAADVAHQRASTPPTSRRRRRLPGADSAARSPRRARASCWRRRAVDRRRAAVRARRRRASAIAVAGAVVLVVAARRPAVRRAPLRRRRHQRPPGRPRPVQQVELVLADRRLRPRRTATGRSARPTPARCPTRASWTSTRPPRRRF